MQLLKAAERKIISQKYSGADYGRCKHEFFKSVNCTDRRGCAVGQLIKTSVIADYSRKNSRSLLLDEHVYRTGDKSESIYIVHSGSIRSYVITDEGDQQVLDYYLPGDVLGLGDISASHHVTSAVALETTSICKLTLSQLDTPEAQHQIFNLMSCQLTRKYNHVLILANKCADGQVASFLLDLSERFVKQGFSSHLFTLPMCRVDVASYLGLAVETVSRTLKKFQEEGFLEINRRRVNILDFESLHKIAGSQVLG